MKFLIDSNPAIQRIGTVAVITYKNVHYAVGFPGVSCEISGMGIFEYHTIADNKFMAAQRAAKPRAAISA